jgi:hypothetical protein
MRLEPKRDQVIGRVAITKLSERIIAPDATKNVTKFVLLEEISPEAEAKGYRRGDLVLPRAINSIFLKGGAYHRAVFSIDEILCVVHDLSFEDLVDVYGNPISLREEAAA